MIEDPPSSLLKALAQHWKHEWSTPMLVPLPRFFSIWKSLHGSINSIAEGGSSTPPSWVWKKGGAALYHGELKSLRSPLQGMRFQGKTKETLGCDWSPSGWIIRYEFLFVKYDWKRWRELLNFSSFPWNWRSEWCVYVAHLQLISHNFKRHVCMKKGSWVIQGRVIQAVGFLERLVPPFDSWKAVALTCFPLKTHLIPKAIMSSFHRMLKNHTAYVKKSWSRESSNPNLSTRDLACPCGKSLRNFSS